MDDPIGVLILVAIAIALLLVTLGLRRRRRSDPDAATQQAALEAEPDQHKTEALEATETTRPQDPPGGP